MRLVLLESLAIIIKSQEVR